MMGVSSKIVFADGEEGDRSGKYLEGNIGKALYYWSWHKEEWRLKENPNYPIYSTRVTAFSAVVQGPGYLPSLSLLVLFSDQFRCERVFVTVTHSCFHILKGMSLL